MYKNQECDIKTKFNLLTKSLGLTNKDIRALLGCSSATASKIIQNIHIEIAKTGLKPNPRIVSVSAFLKYMNWEIESIISLYKKIYIQ